MARAIIARTKELLISSWKQPQGTRRTVSRFTGITQQYERTAEQAASRGDGGDDEKLKWPTWVPHPITGIYHPNGHERVIDDIPQWAASPAETYWPRDIDGVDRRDPDLYT